MWTISYIFPHVLWMRSWLCRVRLGALLHNKKAVAPRHLRPQEYNWGVLKQGILILSQNVFQPDSQFFWPLEPASDRGSFHGQPPSIYKTLSLLFQTNLYEMVLPAAETGEGSLLHSIRYVVPCHVWLPWWTSKHKEWDYRSYLCVKTQVEDRVHCKAGF